MESLVWINGEIQSLREAKVSLEDRGYQFGDGVYEVIRFYNSCPFALNLHLDRLHNSATAIRINNPFSRDEMTNAISDLIKECGYSEGNIYMQLTRGQARRDHLFPEAPRPVLVIYLREMEALKAPAEVRPINTITVPDERWMNCYIKTVNLLPNLLATQQAEEAGAQEAIFYRPGGVITEGTRSNAFAVINGVIRTHPETNLILSGIIRKVLIRIMKEAGITCEERALSLEELLNADEVFMTSSTIEVAPVAKIDGKLLPRPVPGPVTFELIERLYDKIKTDCWEG